MEAAISGLLLLLNGVATSGFGRFPLLAIPRIELPVLASKQLLVRRDFQRRDMLESANSGLPALQYLAVFEILIPFDIYMVHYSVVNDFDTGYWCNTNGKYNLLSM